MIKRLLLSVIFFWVINSFALADDFRYKPAPDVKVKCFNQNVVWATDPVYWTDILYVPLRDIAPELELSVFTNRRTLKSTIKRYKDDFNMVITEGSHYVHIGSKTHDIKNAVKIIYNRIYIPMYVVLSKMGYSVLKDQNGNYIVKNAIYGVKRKGNKFFLYAGGPLKYKPEYDKKNNRIKLYLKDSHVSKSFKYGNDKNLGTDFVLLKQSANSSNDAVFDVDLKKGAKYSMYELEGQNTIELDVNMPGYNPDKKVADAEDSIDEQQFPVNTAIVGGEVDESSEDTKLSAEPPKTIKTTGKYSGPSKNSIWLPSLKTKDEIHFSVNGTELIMKPPYVYKEGNLMVPLKTFYEKAGYSVYVNRINKEASLTRDDGIDFLIKADSREIIDRENNKKYTLGTNNTLLTSDMYVPLIDFTRILGMGIRWDSKSEKVLINHRIYEVLYEEVDGQRQVTVKGTGPVYFLKISEISKPSSLLITIPNANLDIPKQILEINDDKVKQIRLAQITQNECRMVIDTVGKVPYGVLATDKNTEGTLRFSTDIKNLAVRYGKGIAEVVFNGEKDISPKYVYLSDPDRIVVDLPGVVLKQPIMMPGDGNVIKRVRVAQFNWNPLVTRIVIDLNKKSQYKVEKTNAGKSVSIYIGNQAGGTQKSLDKAVVKAVPTLKTVKPTLKAPVSSMLKGKVIVIEAGHGGMDPGAVGKKGTKEKKYTLSTAMLIKEELIKRGAKVIMARESDVFMNLYNRVIIANNNRADAYVSVHFNSFTDGSASGTETYYYKPKDFMLSKFVHEELVKSIKRTNKGIKKANLYVLHYTSMPAVLIEPLFLSNKWDEMIVHNPKFQAKIASGVAQGLERYFRYRKSR